MEYEVSLSSIPRDLRDRLENILKTSLLNSEGLLRVERDGILELMYNLEGVFSKIRRKDIGLICSCIERHYSSHETQEIRKKQVNDWFYGEISKKILGSLG